MGISHTRGCAEVSESLRTQRWGYYQLEMAFERAEKAMPMF